MKCNLCGNPLFVIADLRFVIAAIRFVIADLSFVIADLIRNPVHPNAWMPPDRSPGQAHHVRHDNACAAVTAPMNKACKPWRFAWVGKPRWFREGSPC